jgi:NAD+ synthase
MLVSKRIDYISNWIKNYAKEKKFNLVVGVSGGIDSAVTISLCAKTNIKTIVVSMPIRQNKNQHHLSIVHINWLKSKFNNIIDYTINLDNVFKSFQDTMSSFKSELAFANSRSRLRMAALYQIAQSNKALVVGTGNKVEDLGIGFYTKYGDGGVDISPIADCTKTQIWEMGRELRISKNIIEAKPTDGLWDDSRDDEDQIGLSYDQLEEAMNNSQSQYFKKYDKMRKTNLHKMKPIPICKFEEE